MWCADHMIADSHRFCCLPFVRMICVIGKKQERNLNRKMCPRMRMRRLQLIFDWRSAFGMCIDVIERPPRGFSQTQKIHFFPLSMSINLSAHLICCTRRFFCPSCLYGGCVPLVVFIVISFVYIAVLVSSVRRCCCCGCCCFFNQNVPFSNFAAASNTMPSRGNTLH